jgi:hypothetical protein
MLNYCLQKGLKKIFKYLKKKDVEFCDLKK